MTNNKVNNSKVNNKKIELKNNTKKLDKIKVRKTKKTEIDVEKNVVRQISNFLNNTFHLSKLKGVIYFNLHLYFLVVIGFITLFSTSVNILLITLVIVSLDAISIVFLHECPLTTMEKKYLGFTSCELRNEYLEKAGIMYNCDHNYEKQIELLINVWSIIASKCLAIIFLNMFNVKLFDVNGVYTTTI